MRVQACLCFIRLIQSDSWSHSRTHLIPRLRFLFLLCMPCLSCEHAALSTVCCLIATGRFGGIQSYCDRLQVAQSGAKAFNTETQFKCLCCSMTAAFAVNTQDLSEVVKVDLAMERTVSSSGTAAVVDGATLLVTPLQRALVPPPMCAVAAVFPHPVQCLAFGTHQGHEVKPFLLACWLLHVCCPLTDAYHRHKSRILCGCCTSSETS